MTFLFRNHLWKDYFLSFRSGAQPYGDIFVDFVFCKFSLFRFIPEVSELNFLPRVSCLGGNYVKITCKVSWNGLTKSNHGNWGTIFYGGVGGSFFYEVLFLVGCDIYNYIREMVGALHR